MEKKEIRKEAKNYFSDKDYRKVIQTIWQLGLDDFITFGLKNKWFNEVELLNEICNTSKEFQLLFKYYRSDEVLYQYFNSTNRSEKFEKKIALEFPELFIKAVRVNQVFTKTDRFDSLLLINLPKEHRVHQDVWKHLNAIDSNLWGSINNKIEKLSGYSLAQILNELVVWLENKRFSNKELFENQHLGTVYSFFIKLYLSKYLLNQKEDLTSESFTLFFLKNIDKQTSEKLSDLLETISKWVNFNDSILSAYSFDLDIQPSIENGIIHFIRHPQEYYKWKLDGIRYNLNRLNYFFKGIEFVEYLTDKEGMQIPKGSKPQDEDGNYQLAIQQWQLTTFLDDLKLNSFVFKGKEIKSQLLFQPLLTYSKNRNIRYEQGLQKHVDSSKNWIESFIKLTKDSIQNNFLENNPFFLMSKEEYIALNNIALQQLPKNSSEEIINLFSFNANPNSTFNRFNIGYNVWHKPFMQFGDYLFCPMMFLANNDWFYGFAQAGLENLNKRQSIKVRKETATEMEIHLGDKLKSKNWNVKVIDTDFNGNFKGDVDIIVSDRNYELLIQLKRTKFRLDLKEAYYESINTDRKASKQLNDAKKFLERDNDIIKLGNKIHKWIVTTSFESVLTEINSCLKINYFDLLQALLNPDIKSIEQLISYIENDSGIKNWLQVLNSKEIPNELKSGIVEAGLPLQLSEPKMYRQVLFADDSSFVEYHNKYNKALELDNKGNKDKAIKILEFCLIENPKDYEVWSALGNIYADKKNFSNSFKCFEKALKIIPNDPFILRNYALAYRDSGNIERTFEIYNKIQRQYWFLDLR
jgi:tetratricopeptide (TPR) repeat protein